MVMHPNFTLEIFAAIPWGDESHQISLTLQDYPLFAEMVPGQMRKIRAPVRIRLDAWGGLHTLAGTGNPVSIQHFDAKGQIIGRTPLISGDSCDVDHVTV